MRISMKIMAHEKEDLWLFDYWVTCDEQGRIGWASVSVAKNEYDRIKQDIEKIKDYAQEYEDSLCKVQDGSSKLMDVKTLNDLYRTKVEAWINRLSDHFTNIRPSEDTSFAVRLKELDESIERDMEYFGDLFPGAHLLLVTNNLDIPWWIMKTYDDEKFWFERYAIGIIPYTCTAIPMFGEIRDKPQELKLSVISRPSSDLKSVRDFSDRLKQLLSKSSIYSLKAEIHDGGNRETEPDKFGVYGKEVKKCFSFADFITYYGHFECKSPASISTLRLLAEHPLEGDRDAFDYLHLENIKVDRKFVFFNACQSAGIPAKEAESVADFFLSKQSPFIGTLYPIFTDGASEYCLELLRLILSSPISFGEAMRRARIKLKQSQGNGEETSLLDYAPYILFGDPSDSLLPEPEELRVLYTKTTRHLFFYVDKERVKRQYTVELNPVLLETPDLLLQDLSGSNILSVGIVPIPQIMKQPTPANDKRERKLKIFGPMIETSNDVKLVLNKQKAPDITNIKEFIDKAKTERERGAKLRIAHRGFEIDQTMMVRMLVKSVLTEKKIELQLNDLFDWYVLPNDYILAAECGIADATIVFGVDLNRIETSIDGTELKVICEVDDFILRKILKKEDENAKLPWMPICLEEKFVQNIGEKKWRIVELQNLLKMNADLIEDSIEQVCEEIGCTPELFQREKLCRFGRDYLERSRGAMIEFSRRAYELLQDEEPEKYLYKRYLDERDFLEEDWFENL